MEKAIKKAIEGGYSESGVVIDNKKLALLDPLFWQALGKAEGWEGSIITTTHFGREWLVYWHNFIDHLAQGKDIDSFFEELLTN